MKGKKQIKNHELGATIIQHLILMKIVLLLCIHIYRLKNTAFKANGHVRPDN